MIHEDRLELNNRFIEVFNLLIERREIVLNDRSGKGIGDFAEKILGNRSYGHIVRAFLNPNDKRVIDYRHARIICKEYGINESYMIDGVGTPLGFDIPEAPVPKKKTKGKRVKTPNILFTTTQAFAGASVGADSFVNEDYEYFSVPNISGRDWVAFPITGNSMDPVVADGDIVICQYIRDLSEIKDNEIYAVKNNGSIWIKYVQCINNDKDMLVKLKLISANYLEHDPFEEEINTHTRLYKVIHKICGL